MVTAAMAEVITEIERLSPEQLASLDAEKVRDIHLLVAAAYEQTMDERCADDPLYWAQGFTKTENPKYVGMNLPFKAPFPRKSYFRPLFSAFRHSKRLLIPKSRDLMTSWCAMVWATHQAQWHAAFTIVQSMKETKSQELVEYASILYREQPAFLQTRHPLHGQTLNEIRWKNGGRILGVPAGENQIRTFHPTRYIVDEVAFLPEAEACWNTVNAADTPQMIGISSAGPGWLAEMCTEPRENSGITMRPAPPPDPETIPEPEPKPEKSVEQELEEMEQHFLNHDPQKEAFSRRREEEERIKREGVKQEQFFR